MGARRRTRGVAAKKSLAKRSPAPARGLEVEFFRFVNRWVEPQIRAGLGSPRLAPGGLIVLETKGRTSGRLARIPLVATRLQGYFLVGTFRGGRSQWAKNLAATPDTRLWVGGKPRLTTAFVLPSGRRPQPLPKLPALLRAVMALLVPYTRAGWTFAVLAPRRRRREAAARRRSRAGAQSKTSG